MHGVKMEPTGQNPRDKGKVFLTTAEENCGAGNEIRTRDLNLGKVALYQLSYSRIFLTFGVVRQKLEV